VGFDSRESLGKKETGAKAALPIWMDVMRVAIAGKDDEKFLGEETENPTLKAAAQPPAKPLPPARPHVKPALPPLPAPARPSGANPRAAVKPALAPAPRP
jgi:penicillin-binding protein 1A